MWTSHRRGWATVYTAFACAIAIAQWVLPKLGGRPLSASEIVAIAFGIGSIVAVCSWARYSVHQGQHQAGDVHPQNLTTTRMESLHPRLTDVQKHGSDQKEFALPANASGSAHRLRWCGKDEVLTAKTFLLREPLVYYSVSAPSDDEPSCIDLSLEVRQPGRIAEPAPSAYPAYRELSPSHRAQYLQWLSKDRTSSVEHIGFVSLYLCGLERRLFLERADLHDIVKETVRLRTLYASNRVLGLRLNQFLAFSLAGRGHDQANVQLMSIAFGSPPQHCTRDDLAVALAWFCEHDVPLPASWALATARVHPRFANNPTLAPESELSKSLFQTRYLKRFDLGLKLKPGSTDHAIRYQPINASLQYREESQGVVNWSIKIPDVLGFESQFTPLADLLAQTVGVLPESNSVPPPPRSQPPVRTPAPIEAIQYELEVKNDSSPRQELAATPSPLRWLGAGTSHSVKGYVLRDPMVYLSQGTPGDAEASCIDSSLEVGKPVWEAAGAVGFYPAYAKITPSQRANYLSWLANGRTRALTDIGYAFLYFYGLERRLVIERHDLSPIAKECVRLLETYTFSGSFDGYVSRFLAFALARSGIETLKDKWFAAVFEKSRLTRDEDFLAVALAWLFRKNARLPVSWAMRIARQDPRSPRSIVLDRLPNEFNSLFERRYQEKFGDGIALKVSKRERSVIYRPASPTLLFDPSLASHHPEPVLIPNVLGIQSQFAPLVAIWTSCIEELKPVSRVLAKGIEVDSRQAFEALPEDLKGRVEHPEKKKWDNLVTEHTRDDGYALVEVAKLAVLYGLEERLKLTPTQSKALAQTAEYMGLDIEPDSRRTTRPYAWVDVVSLLRRDEEPGQPADSRYLAASLMLELGIYIAAADGSVDDVEVDQVARFIESQFLLSPPEVRRLEALKRVFVARPPTLSGLGKRLQADLTRAQREAVGRFLTGVAAANGIIDRKEISALKSAYRALDIGVDQLNSLLEESRRATDEPVEVDRGEESAPAGELIPPKPGPARPVGLVLDERRLGAILAETQIVIETLGKAMLDPGVADEPETAPALPLNDPRFDALDARYHAMLAQLLVRQAWPRPEFNSLARSCNLMPAGVLDAVNDWAFELFDDPILVDLGDSLEIQAHLLETL